MFEKNKDDRGEKRGFSARSSMDVIGDDEKEPGEKSMSGEEEGAIIQKQ